MTDRELLELAAKAAGVEVEWSDITECFWGDGDSWVPLDDDGDALRLAVKLKMFLDLEYCCAKSIDNPWFGGGEDNLAGVNHDEDDPYAATRRAIVRAAAEIGKSMGGL